MGATPRTNRSAKGGNRSSPHYGGEGVLIHPPHQGVCGRHGTEDQYVSPALSSAASGVSGGMAGSTRRSSNGVRRCCKSSRRFSDGSDLSRWIGWWSSSTRFYEAG